MHSPSPRHHWVPLALSVCCHNPTSVQHITLRGTSGYICQVTSLHPCPQSFVIIGHQVLYLNVRPCGSGSRRLGPFETFEIGPCRNLNPTTVSTTPSKTTPRQPTPLIMSGRNLLSKLSHLQQSFATLDMCSIGQEIYSYRCRSSYQILFLAKALHVGRQMVVIK